MWERLSWRKEKCEMARTALLSFHKYHDFWSSQNLPLQKWLQTAVSKPSDGICWNILAEGRPLKSTPFPLLFNIFLASTFILSNYPIFLEYFTPWAIYHPKVVHDTFKDFEHVKFSSCNFSLQVLILVSPSFNICYTFVFKWLSIIGLDVHGLPRWLKG